MKTTTQYLVLAGLVTFTLGPDEELKLRDPGTIQSFEKLDELALAQHPGGVVRETKLENEFGWH